MVLLPLTESQIAVNGFVLWEREVEGGSSNSNPPLIAPTSFLLHLRCNHSSEVLDRKERKKKDSSWVRSLIKWFLIPGVFSLVGCQLEMFCEQHGFWLLLLLHFKNYYGKKERKTVWYCVDLIALSKVMLLLAILFLQWLQPEESRSTVNDSRHAASNICCHSAFLLPLLYSNLALYQHSTSPHYFILAISNTTCYVGNIWEQLCAKF